MARVLRGVVVSAAMDKTVIVAVKSLKEHPIYRKKYNVTAKFAAHDDTGELKVGELVEITETRPLSRTKHFKVSRTITRQEVELGA